MILNNYSERIYKAVIHNSCTSTPMGLSTNIIRKDSKSKIISFSKSPDVYTVAKSLTEAAIYLNKKGLAIKSIEEFTEFYISDNMHPFESENNQG